MIDDKTVQLSDGHTFEAEAIILCTGYAMSFPFLDPSLAYPKCTNLMYPLYERVWCTNNPRLMFLSNITTQGPKIYLTEVQVTAVTEYIKGNAKIPS